MTGNPLQPKQSQSPAVLHQTQDLNQQILDSSGDCIKVLDLEGRILFMNLGGQALLAIEDITPFLNTSWVNFWPEADRPAAEDAIARAAAGEVTTVQGYCPAMNGEPKWWDNKISPIRGADGQIDRLLCISRDITKRVQLEEKRQQAEERLRQSEERYRAIVNQALTGVAYCDLSGRLVLVNQKYCDITRYSAEELSQLRMRDITHPEDLPRNVELYQRMLAEGTPFEIEKRYIRKDGSTVWVNNYVSVICDRSGQPQSVIAIVLDITERKQAETDLQRTFEELQVAEEELREQNEELAAARRLAELESQRYQDLFNFAPDSYIITDTHGVIQEVNQAASVLLAVEQSFLINTPLAVYVAEPDRRAFRSLLYKMHLQPVGQKLQSDELCLQPPGRQPIPVAITGTVLCNAQGQVVGSRWLIQNITERKQSEELARRTSQLNAFRASLGAALRPLADPAEIQAAANRELGEYLGASRVAYFEVRGTHYFVERDYADGVEPLAGGYPVESFGAVLLQSCQAGRVVCVFDVDIDPDLSAGQRAAYAAIRVRAYIAIPLIKAGEFVAGLTVHMAEPWAWTADEVTVAKEVAELTWAAVERARAEMALRQSEAKYRSLFESMDEGFCILQMIFDGLQPIDYRFLEVNPVFAQQTGMKDALGKTILELVPDIEPFWIETYGKVALTGEPTQFVDHSESLGRWFDVNAFRIGEPHEHKVAVLFNDISDRKYAELNAQFLATVTQDLMGATEATPVEGIVQTVGERLNQYLKTSIFALIEVDQEASQATINYDWHQHDAPSLKGVYDLTEFVSWEFRQAARAGQAVVVSDIFTDSRIADQQKFTALNIGSFINIPLIRDNQWKFTLGVYRQEPYSWRSDEVELMRELANRIWTKLERTRAEIALRKSEERYRTLFSSMDEGYALADVIFDECDRPVDILYLEANPAAQRLTGLELPGRRLRELDPDYDSYWWEIFGRVAQTGVGERHELYSTPLKAWYNFYVFKAGEPNSRRVATVFQDVTQRKRFEQERERFLTVGSDFLVITSMDGYFHWVSPSFERLLGWTPQEMTSRPWTDFVHPDDVGSSQAETDSLFSGSETFAFENRYRHKDGSYRWLLWNAKPYPQERVIYGGAVDITDRKLAEVEREQLLLSERHYATQLQGLTSAALLINSALSVEDVVRVITDQAAAIIGAHLAVTSMTVDQNWSQAINAFYLSDKYAQWRDYEEDPDGSGIYTRVCHLNRPMRMTQAELEAHPSWKGFSKAADGHPPMRGCLAAPLVGRDGKNLGLIQLSDKLDGEFTSADESILVQLAQMASVAIENARLYKAEQRARAAAEAAREEAQAANRVKDEFLAVLSHELRSPLNPILGWSTLLQSNKLDEAKTAQALATIQRNAKLQSELIEDLLDVSRILRGKLSLSAVPVRLDAIIRAAMETVRLAAEAKFIHLEAALAPEIGLVSGDSTRLQQVIWNLLSNAVKFTPEGGRVTVRLEQTESKQIEPRVPRSASTREDALPRRAYAQITVTDTGQGIEPEFLPYVFDYFRQADGATTRKFGGLGLGLAIVHHLVELHGGTVEVESPGVGQGATFVVRLPLMPASTAAGQTVQAPEQALDLQGVKVLVVDDEADSREFAAFLLEQQGAQVTAVASAYEALLALEQVQPDVLLSDIGMPEMDGYMLIRQVRALSSDYIRDLPAIALTAYAGEIDQQQALAAGFQRHISKPIEPEVLVREVSGLLSKTR
ncbi:MAG TPA: PAS domain S-box protein [Trichocoleus sp.]